MLLISPKLLSPYSWEGVPWPSSSHFAGALLNSALFVCAVPARPAALFGRTPANSKNYSSRNKMQRASGSGHRDFNNGNKHIIKRHDKWSWQKAVPTITVMYGKSFHHGSPCFIQVQSSLKFRFLCSVGIFSLSAVLTTGQGADWESPLVVPSSLSRNPSILNLPLLVLLWSLWRS